MSSVELFWTLLKQRAQEYARGGGVTASAARSIVRDLLNEAGVQPAPPDDVYQFYAREFTAFVHAARIKQHFLHK